MGGDGHALHQHERIGLHQQAVGKGAAVALVGIADDVFVRPGRGEHRFPLDARGKSRTAAAAKAGGLHPRHDLCGGEGERRLQPLQPPMGAIVRQTQRIGQSRPGEGQPGLAGEEGQGLDRPEALGVRPARKQTGRHEAGHVGCVHRAIADASLRRLDLHQGLEGEQAAGAVAHHMDVDPGGAGGRGEGRGHLVGADGDGGHVSRHIDAHAHRPSSAIRASRRRPDSRATGASSTRAAGPLAHRPRQ